MDAPAIASVSNAVSLPPSALRQMIPELNPRSNTKLDTNTDDLDDASQDNDIRVHSLRPTNSSYNSRSQNLFRQSNQDNSNQPSRVKGGFCGEPGHKDHRCNKQGEAFWSSYHAQKGAQYNLVHGKCPTSEQKAKHNSAPAPPNAKFKPRLHPLQASIGEQAKQLEEDLENISEGKTLMVKALSVRHQIVETATNQE